MPLSKPNGREDRDAFIQRCMSELSDEFSDESQRAAVCHRQWRDHGKHDAAPIEHKTLPLAQAEIEVKAGEGRPVVVTGYASTFGNVDFVGDIVQPGAFVRSVGKRLAAGRTFPMRYEHDSRATIGKWLRLAEDSKGLHVEGELTPGHRLAEDVAALLRHQAIEGLSIGYRILDAERDRKGNRILKEIELVEVSVVGSPANDEARVVGLKSADEILTTRDFEEILREVHGFSHRAARKIAMDGFKAYVREERARDSEPAAVREERGSGTDDQPRKDEILPPELPVEISRLRSLMKSGLFTP